MASWLQALKRTRNVFGSALSRLFKRGKVDAETLEELESALVRADVAPRLAAEIVAELEKELRGEKEPDALHALRQKLLAQFSDTGPYDWGALPTPGIILMVGVNGSGKTTTCAKLAQLSLKNGRKPILGAADTFRAAGTEQLRMWAEKVGCEVVSGVQGSDAAAVAFDTTDAAVARGRDLAFIDTAGRMHTKAPLMEELRKMVRSITKRIPDAPHETWIVLDASIGQNALKQALMFHQAVPLSGIVVTKLDGSSKAGFLFSIRKELNVPIRFIGLGEGENDLVPFDANLLIDGMFESREGDT